MSFFVVPYRSGFVVYHPRRHLAFGGNRALVDYVRARGRLDTASRSPDMELFLQRVGFDMPPLPIAKPRMPEPFAPTQAVLLMTNRCNLRCTYCYANAGQEPMLREMPWPLAKAAVDAVIRNAREVGETPALTFHGGGEPTVHWSMLVRTVEYARQQEPGIQLSVSSNGVWTPQQREFIRRHFQNVSLSFDGVAAVQNRNRPRLDGTGTYAAVLESLAALDQTGTEYGVRMTVLPQTVRHLVESVKLVCERTQARAVQIEPTFTSDRGRYADIGDDFADAFTEAFLQAWQVGQKAGRSVYYSAARPWVLAPFFCLAPLRAMVVTADGRLVTCFEVFSELSPLAAAFTVGHVRPDGVEFDQDALATHIKAQQKRRSECRACFCYWHCCGDCATRRQGPPNMDHGRCRATRAITLRLLLGFMEAGGGLWQGLRHVPGTSCSMHDHAVNSPNGGYQPGALT